MNILLISNYPPDRQESMLRYARLLQQEFQKRGHAARIAYPPSPILDRAGPNRPFAKWLAYLDKYLLAPAFLRRQVRDADIVHVCDHSNSMYLRLAGKTPGILTCHDLLAVFAAQGRFAGIRIGGTGRLLQRWIASGILHAPSIICVSHKTDTDLRELAAGSPPPSTVVYNPLNWDFHPVPFEETAAVLAARGLTGSAEYLIHIGNNSWYKNRPAAVRIFAELKKLPKFSQTKLLLAGKPWDAELRTQIASTEAAADIHELIDVSNEELRALYSGAAALLFPSRHEGFGWPILEAQASGCPVITTNRPPMTEVASAAAILIDPGQPAAAAETIAAEWNTLATLIVEGFENIHRFSMDKTIDGYIAAYEAAIQQQTVR
jgi:glycosyltransferase involved in cell wall biosynthesis